MYIEISLVIFGFPKKKKNPPVADENLSRCTDGISLGRLEDHLGPEKKRGFSHGVAQKKLGHPQEKRNAG